MSTSSYLPPALAAMPPALVVLLGAVMIELISWLGFALISEQLFRAYRMLFHRTAYASQESLRAEVLAMRTELQGLSAMDEFARWARVRRQLDSKTAAYDQSTSDLRSMRSSFLIRAHIVTRAMFYLLYVGLSIAFRSTPMLYVSDDWVPGVLGWLVSLPFAPESGSVSVVVWVYACRRVTRNLIEMVVGEGKLDAVATEDGDETQEDASSIKKEKSD
ncbi:CHD5-like protein-domain-containing protein [Blastocladiella britannica]|nr:CHD5-like protein-domain-containing protein [Blastocladiella britannica]